MTPSPPSTELIVLFFALPVLIWWAWEMVDKYWPEDRPPQDGTNLGE